MPPTPAPRLRALASALVVGAAVALLWIRFEAGSRPPASRPPPPTLKMPSPRTHTPALADPNELARLRAENTSLREQLRVEADAHSSMKEELADALHELNELRRPLEIDMASATLRAQLRPGEGVVTGGYRLPDGTRLFAFVETESRPDGGIGVMSRFYSVPDGLAPALGLQTLLTEASNTLQHGEVWVGEEIADTTQKMQQSGLARPIGLGATSLQSGDASIVPLASDPPITFRVYAERDAQNQLDLELRLESVPPAPPAP